MNNVRHHFGHHASTTEGSSLQVENLSVCIILYQQGFKDFKNDKDADKDKYKDKHKDQEKYKVLQRPNVCYIFEEQFQKCVYNSTFLIDPRGTNVPGTNVLGGTNVLESHRTAGSTQSFKCI